MAVLLKCSKFIRLSSLSNSLKLYSSRPGKIGLVLGGHLNASKEFELTPGAKKYNKISEGKLCESIKLVEDKLKAGKCFIFWKLDCKYDAIAVCGLGDKVREHDDFENYDIEKESIRIATAAGCKALEGVGVKSICVDDMGDPEAAAEGSTLGLWKFQECKSKQECPPEFELYAPVEVCEEDEDAWKRGVIKGAAQNQARWLADMPANLMTPHMFTENVKKIFESVPSVCVQVHNEQWAKKLGMNAFLAVAQGSNEPPYFLELSYCQGGQNRPFILVGKGVTFDSGGISIKPSNAMDEMRGDMGGAATCVATLKAVADQNLRANVKVLIPLCENMPSGKAVKPGDVVQAMNGKTIGVNNTDAEGRLILADALCYASKFNPEWIMDIATLTGAIRVALGTSATGVFTNSDTLYKQLERASKLTGDRVWRFPLWKHYTKEITEEAAYDVDNIGKGGGGGSCIAAAFLREFVPKDIRWLHLDIASVMGTATELPYLVKGMTGRPTRTIIEFIKMQSCLKKC